MGSDECTNCGSEDLRPVEGRFALLRCGDCGELVYDEPEEAEERTARTKMRNSPWTE